jgi:hypothetical protein
LSLKHLAISAARCNSSRIDSIHSGLTVLLMRAVEFTTELGKQPVVMIPEDAAAKLPKSGRARVIVLTPDDPEDAEWRTSAYEQFVRGDSTEDAVYDSYQ